jgi:hypothetical protein
MSLFSKMSCLYLGFSNLDKIGIVGYVYGKNKFVLTGLEQVDR